ncbi:hypothetical protein E2C01_091559 [Portunus trituberculatus]|uniref:Uncharacterized protein n=1 Tax=Portunus trituberculatus TaxID=210409 RepID=A0A5B7JT86_PORTR|nr:hypothetical protein [Portunus trituberculatus]
MKKEKQTDREEEEEEEKKKRRPISRIHIKIKIKMCCVGTREGPQSQLSHREAESQSASTGETVRVA